MPRVTITCRAHCGAYARCAKDAKDERICNDIVPMCCGQEMIQHDPRKGTDGVTVSMVCAVCKASAPKTFVPFD